MIFSDPDGSGDTDHRGSCRGHWGRLSEQIPRPEEQMGTISKKKRGCQSGPCTNKDENSFNKVFIEKALQQHACRRRQLVRL